MATPDSTLADPFFVYRFDPRVELLAFQQAVARPLAEVAARPLGAIADETFTIVEVTIPPLPAGPYQWLTTLVSADGSRASPPAAASFALSP